MANDTLAESLHPIHKEAHGIREVLLNTLLYSAILLLLVNVRPLWLDEVIELHAASATWSELPERIADNPGGAPIGYAGQWILTRALGVNVWSARLPSVLAGVLSFAAILLLCRRFALGKKTVIVAAALWCICPLVLRYSLEGRPYMQGMLFAILTVLAQLKLSERHSLTWAAALSACLGAAVYSQPFSVFAPLGYSVFDIWRRQDRKYTSLTFAAYASAGLLFLPWLLTARPYWPGSIARTGGDFHLSPSLLMMMVKESMGDGYLTAIPAIVAAAYSSASILRGKRDDPRTPLLSAVLAAVVLAFVADAQFHYFFAIRQVIYFLPFLLILMAEGLTMLYERPRYRAAAVLLGVLFTGAALEKNYRHLTDRSEDWARLSTAIFEALQDGCVLIPDRTEAKLYSVFYPELVRSRCGPGLPDRVVVPVHPYRDPASMRLIEQMLAADELREIAARQVGFATVKVFEP